MSLSHPSQAARAMLKYKGIEHELVSLQAGSQPITLRLAGFRGRTVPALALDGRKVQGSLAISRALEELKPDPPLFPADRRAAVEEAEAWGERELQPLPRRLFRWPTARYFAYLSRASDDHTRAGVARLPELFDHVDALIADGTIGRPGEPTAADFQIGCSIAVLVGMRDIQPALEGRPAAELGKRLFPRGIGDLPAFLPEEWLAPLRG